MSFQQARSGPFGIMDFVGLDVVRDVASGQLNKPLFHHDAQKIVDFLEPFLNSGRLGVKTGQGFYSYPNPEYLKPDFLTAKPADRNLYVPLLRRLLAAAIMLVVLGDASAETVDLTWTITTRSPLGPFGTLKSQWLEIMLNELSVHAAQTDPGGVAERVADFLQKHL
jgi:3-hydroxybutyryl-CoA dehydrogenase